MNNLEQSWDKNNQKKLDLEDGKYKQLCVWPATMMEDNTPEDFENFMKEQFGVRAHFVEEVVTIADNTGEGGRHDLFFYIHNDDIGKFAIPRLSQGIRWWEDVIQNRSHLVYPQEIIDKYKPTW